MSVRTDEVNLRININGDPGKKELSDLRKKAADLSSEIKDLTLKEKELNVERLKAKKNLEEVVKQFGQNSAEAKKARDAYNSFNAQQVAIKKTIAESKTSLKGMDEQMAALRKTIGITAMSQKELVAELKRLHAMKNILTPQTQEFKSIQKEIDAVNKRLRDVKNGTFGFEAAMGGIKKEIGGFGMLAAGYLGFDFITSQFKNILDGSGKVTDKIGDLRRIINLTQDDAERLYDGLRNLDTRTSNDQLLDLAIIAGKLGIEKSKIIGFAAALDELQVALGNEVGDADAIASELGKIINVYDDGAKITGERAREVGNAIVTLANAGVASAPFIIGFTQRLAGIANAADISLDSVMGLGAGFEELGQSEEVASTAVTQIVGKIGQDLPKYAKLAGKDVQEFAQTLRTSPVEALLQLAEGLTKNKNGFNEIAIAFKDAEANGVRVTGTLATLGTKADFFREKIKIAGNALRDTSALTEAYQIKNETLGATMDKIGKRINAIFTNSSFNDFLKTAAREFAILIGASDRAKSALAQFNEEQKKVKNAEAVIPLLDEFDKLIQKQIKVGAQTKLSKEEQERQLKIINDVSKVIPFAITQFDKYGNAIAISTEKARDYIKIQQSMLKIKNEQAIKEMQEQLVKAEKEADRIRRALNLRDEEGNLVKRVQQRQSSFGEHFQSQAPLLIKLTANEITNLQAQAAAAEERLVGIRGILDELTGKGLEKALKPKSEAEPPGGPPVIPSSEEEQKKADERLKRLQKLKEEIAKLSKDVNAAAAGEDATEVERLMQKYADLLKEARELSYGIAALSELQKQELDALFAKQFTRRSEKEYQQQLDDLTAFYEKQKQQADRFYVNGEIDYNTYKEILKTLDYDESQARLTIAEDYSNNVVKAAEEAEKLKTAAVHKGVEERKKLEEDLAKDDVFIAQRKVLTTSPSTLARLDAEKALLEAKFALETQFMERTSQEYVLKQEQLNVELQKLDESYISEKTQRATQMLDKFGDLFENYASLITQQEQEDLQEDKQRNTQKKNVYKRQLDSKLISKKQYDALVEQADREMEAKEREAKIREFNRNKAASLFAAVLNTAQAITKAFAETSPFLAPIFAGIAAATGAIQIAKIASQKPPQAKRGLVLPGPSHEADGVDIVERRTGKVLVNAEGGEPMAIFSRETYRNNRELIDALMYSSQNLNGAQIIAGNWYRKPGPQLRASVAPSLRTGGMLEMVQAANSAAKTATSAAQSVAQTARTAQSITGDTVLTEMLAEQRAMREEMRRFKGKLYATVSYKEITEKQELVDKARAVSGINQAA